MEYRVIEGITVSQIEDEMNKAAAEGYRFAGALTGRQASVVIMEKGERTFSHKEGRAT